MDNIKRIVSCDQVSSQSTTSIEIFYRHVYSLEGRQALLELRDNVEDLSALAEKFRVCKPTDALWLSLMLKCFPSEESVASILPGEAEEDHQTRIRERTQSLKILQELNDAFDAAVRVPSGLRLKHVDFGNCHINVAAIGNLETASKVAVRILITTIEQFAEKRGSEIRNDCRILDFLKACVERDGNGDKDADSMTRVLAVRTVSRLVGVGYDARHDYRVHSESLRNIFASSSSSSADASPSSSSSSLSHVRYLAGEFIEAVFNGLVVSFRHLEAVLLKLREVHERVYAQKEVRILFYCYFSYSCL
jgi:hypothetical protein